MGALFLVGPICVCVIDVIMIWIFGDVIGYVLGAILSTLIFIYVAYKGAPPILGGFLALGVVCAWAFALAALGIIVI